MRISYRHKRIAPFIIARARSLVLDHLIICGLTILLHFFLLIFFSVYLPFGLDFDIEGALKSYEINFSLIYLTYFFGMNYFFNGQTWGQKLFSIGSINNKNFRPEQISLWSSIQRSSANYICFKLGLFLFLFPIFNKKNLSIADFISETHQSYSFYDDEESKTAA